MDRIREAKHQLRRRKAEAGKMGMALAPFLDEVMDRLRAFIDSDLSFPEEEREKRRSPELPDLPVGRPAP